MDFTEPESSIGRAEMPKPPGYSEMHAADLDDTKVATKKVDQMSLKLKVKSVALRPARAVRAALKLRATTSIIPHAQDAHS